MQISVAFAASKFRQYVSSRKLKKIKEIVMEFFFREIVKIIITFLPLIGHESMLIFWIT